MPRACAILIALCGLLLALASSGLAAPPYRPQPPASGAASPDVPLDSWVYAAFDRLAAEGYLPTAYFSLRPWSRTTCARLVMAAASLVANQPARSSRPADAPVLLASLQQEFGPELRAQLHGSHAQVRLESLDQRLTAIAGQPLTDGFHFAETLVNDEGRPFAEGWNLYTGLSLRANAGPFAAYFRTEVQRSPAEPPPNAAAEQQIAHADFTPLAAAGPLSGILRGRVLDANVSFQFAGNQFTLGRQSLWWGPARSGSTLFSDNAEPIAMMRYNRVQPFLLPGLLHRLGSVRLEAMVGRLAGAQFSHPINTVLGTPGVALNDQPWIHGEKLSFKPTPNLEWSISRTVVFAGAGAPLTPATFLRSEFSFATGNGASDPGDRRGAIDARYRIPTLRNCLTAYFDGFSDDLALPVVEPTQNTWLFGGFLRCVPRLPRLTVRVESLTAPHRDGLFPGFFYFNVHYLSGYTNNRQLIGSWIGREGKGEQTWLTWNLSPRSSVEVSGRSVAVPREFLQGGRLQDLNATVNLALRAQWQLRLEEQMEWWRFPLLAPSGRRDAALTLQLSFCPPGGLWP